MELKEKTKLSSRTLSKHLSRMTNLRAAERKTDTESGEYPIPVLYKATPEFITHIVSSKGRKEIIDTIEPALTESKDPLAILDGIHASSEAYFVTLLREIQNNKITTGQAINYYAECFLWANYRHLTSKLIEESRKIINEIDINKLQMDHIKRQIRVNTALLKIYSTESKQDIEEALRRSDIIAQETITKMQSDRTFTN